jgi:tetratricopeptide (TPR) repeat protein
MSDDISPRSPDPKEPEGESFSVEEAEKFFLAKLRYCESELERTILDLVILYSQTGRQDMAMPYLQRWVAYSDDPEKKAHLFLKMGQLMEQSHNYEAAIGFYSQAFSLEPVNSEVWFELF